MSVDRGATTPVIPFATACAGIAIFTYMDAVMKGLSLLIGAYCAMLWRTVAAVPITGALLLARGGAWPARSVLILHAKRGAVTALSATGYFYGLTKLPMAEGIALSFISPLVALYCSAVLLGERIGMRTILASLLGLAGVGVLIAGRLTGAVDEAAVGGGLAILGAAAIYGYGITLLRRQAQAASPTEIAFFQNGTTLLWLLPLAPWLAPLPALSHWPMIILGAALAQTSVFLLAWAYARAEAKTLIPVEYTAFVWSAIFGALMFGEALSTTVLAGAALIVTGCLIAAFARSPQPMAAEVSL
ncbi:DMT family transporter [Sphingomonas sp.]|uniref:DMT family transporter n=1 Tax=Sphingomonas sp. TaxID=28214 RepID=UPI000DB6880F|nr:DMT family transporter [Sphingomonas sp.]PZU07221.1 MAG: EamA family transporter [Sphingomonas sp.]